ncbi:Mitochondrial Carrier (MC) protein [Phytophthora megakarya]|uniref:Mitochondrial Carrier (MC) protein n=1 Tax=Phytophthora megakarya TaxID=4795 RepID=A0A225UM63_9STRA|nr:Mitochondrial Carrier (MC) protein [Phytophthora megakarya]
MPDVSMETAPSSPKKPKIKDVRCSNFKGNEIYPGLGAGFENFIHEFEHAIHTEELVNGSTWTNDIKASVIVNFLEDKASRYYHKKNSEWQRRHDDANMPYSDVKRAMRAEFGFKLSQLELSTKMRCNKREGDSWHEYLEYLNFIESLMEGDQTKMVIEVFGNNACPDLAPTLLSSVPDDTQDYIVETDRMERLLYKLRGDGRKFGTKRDDRKIRNSDRRNHSSHNDRSHDRNNRKNDDYGYRNQRNNDDNSDKRSHQQSNGQVFAAAAAGNRGEIRCHVCGQPGHKIFTCPIVEQAKKLASSSGSANIALSEVENQTSVGSIDKFGDTEIQSTIDSDDEAHGWMAASEQDGSSNKTTAGPWTVDSGATHHLCTDREQVFALEPAFLTVKVANGNRVASTERGSTLITVIANGEKKFVLLKNVYYAKGIDRNLISVSQLTERGY